MILVRTPKPEKTESLMGYVIRVSEANGYDSPWHFLRMAGVCQSEMLNLSFPLERFANLLGVTSASLSNISYMSQTGDGTREYALLGHALGSTLNFSVLRRSMLAMCPECVRENGFIDAFFDLKLAVACPIHRRPVVTHCPSCQARLNLFRPGLLTCKCGTEIADSPHAAVSPMVLDLMSIVWAKVHNTRLSSSSIQRNLPAENLLALTLRRLVVNIPNLLRLDISESKKSIESNVEAVAQALSAWPHGLQRFVQRCAEKHGDDLVSQHILFKQVCASFFRSDLRESFEWLYRELMRLCQPDAALLRETLHEEAQHRFNRNNTQDGGGATASISSATKTPQFLQLREAAAFLGLPVSVLAYLSANKNFHRTICKEKIGYSLEDLDAFFSNLLSKSPPISRLYVDTEATVSLSHALGHYRMHDRQKKAALVVAYLSGELRSIGRIGESTGDILFNLEDIKKIVMLSRANAARGTLTQQEAADIIGCEQTAVSSLISGGYLKSKPYRVGLRVTKKSLDEFSKKYAALGKIAKDQKTNSRNLLRVCKKASIPVLRINKTYNLTTPFVQRIHVPLLLSAASQYPPRRRASEAKAQTEHPSVIALRTYLYGLEQRNEPLPRRARQPNKVAISKACGFPRDVLYDNAIAIALLKTYASRETIPERPAVVLKAYLEERRRCADDFFANVDLPSKKEIAIACGFSRDVFYHDTEAISVFKQFLAQKPHN